MTSREPELEIPAVDGPQTLLRETGSVWRIALRRFFRRKIGVTGLVLVGFMILIALLAPVIAPYSPYEDFIGEPDAVRWAPPCVNVLGCEGQQHLFGLDGNVRDLYSRVLYGARVSLPLGFTTVLVAIIVGALIGSIAGYVGGWLDNVLMRIMDVVLGFPSLILAIAIVFVLGPGIRNTLLAIAIVTLPQYARVMRASVLSVKEIDYVAASRALGSSPARILFTRVIPNALTPLVVLGTLGIAGAILEAAALGFLGLGAQPPTPEWGRMLADETARIFTAPHLMIFPGLAIVITVLGFNMLGDGLRDALDPSLNE
ncbi:MAG TPA: ABC transporter permease [Acidimicrobiia bacterium]|jgi:peptide/nickel transport system permease protein